MRFEIQMTLALPWETQGDWAVIAINDEAARQHVHSVGYQVLATHARYAFADKHKELLDQSLETNFRVEIKEADKDYTIFIVHNHIDKIEEEIIVGHG